MTAPVSGSNVGALWQVGRYAIYDPIATGGMATVHLGRLVGPVGFARTVAIKRLHPQFARDPEFVSMFLDEARLAARIQHPNVLPTIDVIATEGELLLVMEYVRGEALGRLIRAAIQRADPGRIPVRIAVAIITAALNGLHAAHEASDESGRVLGIVHRDVSPQNVIIGMDGVTRVLDFGVAKAEDRVQITKDQKLKGKLLYMSPEQLEGGAIDRRTDIYAMGVVLFETLTSERMFRGEREAAQLVKISKGETRVPSEVALELASFDGVVRKAVAMNPEDRYATAREMSRALEAVMVPASTSEVGEWVEAIAGTAILERTRRVAEIESVNRLGIDAVRASLTEELERSRSDSAMHRRAPDSGGALPSSAGGETSGRWMLALVCALVGLIAMASLSVFLLLHRTTPAVTAGAPASATLPQPTVVERAPRPPATTDSIETAPIATNGESALPVAATSAMQRHKSAPVASAKKDCEQPYVVDSTGHMHFRKECL